MDVVMISAEKLDLANADSGHASIDREFAEQLAESIDSQGLLHPPTVTPIADKPGHFKVIAGKKRAYACGVILKKPEIPCRVVHGLDAAYEEAIADAENVWRLPPDDEQRDRALRRWYEAYTEKYPNAIGSGGHNKGHVPRHDGQFVGRNSKNGSAVEERKTPSFAQALEVRLGVSPRTAQRLTRALKNLMPIEVDVLRALEASNATINKLAALGDRIAIEAAVEAIVGGTNPDEACRLGKQEAEKAEIKPKLSKQHAQPKSEKDLTDTEWVEQNCSRIYNEIENKRAFVNDASLWRRISGPYFNFRRSLQKPVQEFKSKANFGNGLFFLTMYRAALARHPSEWIVCGECDGTGRQKDAPDKRCGPCVGGGYKMPLEV
jgi:hypothetical protein